jgi:hypothetical protein
MDRLSRVKRNSAILLAVVTPDQLIILVGTEK